MINLARKMNQTCTYWAMTGGTSVEGRPVVASQEERLVRWEDVVTVIQDKNGAEYVSKAIVYSDQDFTLQGYLALGSYGSGYDPTEDPRRIFEIMQVSRVPDLRYMQTLCTAYL